MKARDMVSMPHSPYSPDLMPSDFYLFLNIKADLEHTGIIDDDQVLEELHTILRSIPGQGLERVFEAWRERVQNVNEGYIN
jgi:hypothetical protein